jgi:glycosyltransferase involved in cell wall biosynthesis
MKISIIIATYNAANVLSRCLESIKAQDYPNIEVVVADGQSTDGTPDILKHYSALMGGRLIWCSEPDKGIGDAWNKAVARASGDWLLFQGSDDTLAAPDVISRAVPILSKSYPTYRIVYGRVAMRSLDGKFLEFFGKPWSDCSEGFRNFVDRIPHQATFHHKSLFSIHGNFHESFKGPDYDFLLRELMVEDPLYIDNLVISNMSTGGVSTRRQYIFEFNLETLRLYQTYANDTHDWRVPLVLYWRLVKSSVIAILYRIGGEEFSLRTTNVYRRIVGNRPPLTY